MANIYVQPLKAYNEGKGGGKWVDIDGLDADDIAKAIQKVLKKSPSKGEEEWIISDYDDMPNMGENPDLEDLEGVLELLEEHGAGTISAYIDHVGEHYFTVDGFRDAFMGVYDSVEDFGWEYLETGDYLDSIPDFLRPHIDVEGFAKQTLLVDEFFGEQTDDGFVVFSRR
jgi:antirestriction protein